MDPLCDRQFQAGLDSIDEEPGAVLELDQHFSPTVPSHDADSLAFQECRCPVSSSAAVNSNRRPFAFFRISNPLERAP